MRKAFLSGYLAADGCKKKNGYAFSTVSKKLAIGGVMLAASLGYGASCGFYKPKNGKTSQIDGRMIVNNGGYICSIYDRPRSAVISSGIHWGRAKSCEPTNSVQTVYDLEVEGDHSYVADGVIVHNCQGFSIAGKRGGLDDPRSGLAMRFVELLAEIRPTWFVWENVPGVFSSEGGRDLASFLGCVSGRSIDVPSRGWKNSGIIEGIPHAYSLAWRTLDAQYFGVPQRRRRVFVVGHLGDWRPPAAVLFERESLSWHNPPRRRTEQAHHAGAIGRAALPIHDKATRYQGGGDTRNGDGSGNGLGIGKVGDPSPTLTSGDRHAVFCFQQNTRDEVRLIGGDGQIAGAIMAEPGMKQQNYVVAFSSKDYGADATIELSPTLRSGEFNKSWANGGAPPAIAFPAEKSPVVRRLTPIECERLQGFPDNWTQVQHKGKPMADGPRYKMCGNSIAVPVIEWIFDRLNQVHQQIEHQ
jgi:DNA (cytosine-5)-methyltransferase 1